MPSKKIAAVAAAAVAAAGIAVPIAQAIEVDQTIAVTKAPKKGSKKKPKGAGISVDIRVNAKDRSLDGTFGTKNAVVKFDKNLRFNNKKFPVCKTATVEADPAKCPKGSQVGKGVANAVAGQGGAVKVNPTITAWNAGSGKLVLRLAKSPGDPVDATGTIVGTLKKSSGKYGQQLVVPIPAKYQEQLGLKVTLTKFQVTITSAKYKGKNYVESIGCTGGKYNFAGIFTFTDNTDNTVTTTQKC